MPYITILPGCSQHSSNSITAKLPTIPLTIFVILWFGGALRHRGRGRSVPRHFYSNNFEIFETVCRLKFLCVVFYCLMILMACMFVRVTRAVCYLVLISDLRVYFQMDMKSVGSFYYDNFVSILYRFSNFEQFCIIGEWISVHNFEAWLEKVMKIP